MRVVAALSFYDEPPELLTRCVGSLAGVADTIVAVDGAYAAFPGARERPASPQEQPLAVAWAASAAGIPSWVTAFRREPWPSEVEKRAYLMEEAARRAGPDGWVLVIDADEYVSQTPLGWREAASEAERLVLQVSLYDRRNETAQLVRRLFRARHGLTVRNLHYRYLTGDGRVLWGDLNEPQEPAGVLRGFGMIHDPEGRSDDRTAARLAYYRHRDEAGLEIPGCAFCGRQAETRAAADPRLEGAGRVVDCGWIPVCGAHRARAYLRFVKRARRIGLTRSEAHLLGNRTGPL